MTIGENMRMWREERGFSLKEVETRTGINNGNLSRYERDLNFPSIELCIKLADLYSITLDELTGRADNFVSLNEQSQDSIHLSSVNQKSSEDDNESPKPLKDIATNNRLLELREEKHLSQDDIAKVLNVSRQAYSRYERGERELGYKALIELSHFFDVSINYLLNASTYYYPDSVPGTYSPEERKLVEDYRGLAKPLKDLVQTVIKTMQEGTQNADFKNGS